MDEELGFFLYIADLFGTAVFAISGALTAYKKRMDIFGMATLAIVTAIGGGTLRDMMLGRPAFWLEDTNCCIWMALAAATLCLLFTRRFASSSMPLLVFDAFGLAVFSVEGAAKSLEVCSSVGVALLMGMMTGAAGGLIRDIICAEVPLIMRREIYATASLCGAGVYILLLQTSCHPSFAVFISILVTLLLRMLALRYNLSLPSMDSFLFRKRNRG